MSRVYWAVSKYETLMSLNIKMIHFCDLDYDLFVMRMMRFATF